MTTTQADFEQLFRACYLGEAPWLALADWLVETGHRGTARVIQEGNEFWNGDRFNLKVDLTIGITVGRPSYLTCYLNLPQFGTQQQITLDRDVFCAGFPAWIANEVELLRMDLRRRGYLKQLT